MKAQVSIRMPDKTGACESHCKPHECTKKIPTITVCKFTHLQKNKNKNPLPPLSPTKREKMGCPSLFFYCCGKILTKSNLGKERIYFIIQIIVHGWEKSEQELKQQSRVKNWSRDHQECCLLSCCSCSLGLLSYTSQNHLPKGGAAHGGLGSPISINTSRKCTHRHAHKPIYGGNISTKILSPQVTLACVSNRQKLIHTGMEGDSEEEYPTFTNFTLLCNCPSVSFAVIKHHEQKKLGEEGVYFNIHSGHTS